MKQITFLLLLIFSPNIHTQETYSVKNFSEKYAAKVIISKDGESAHVSIYEIKTGKELIQEELESIFREEITDGELASNIVERPYGEQSIIICNDFNCDGEDDIAIKIGDYSCYGGPAYNVYLSENGVLTFNDQYSSLAQEYCGFFDYDCTTREIYTMTKSGCCWHQYQTFSIGEDSLILKNETVYNGMALPFPLIEEKTWQNGKEVEKTKIYDVLIDTLLIFPLANKDKTVILFEYLDRINYCFLDKDDNIEFDFYEDFSLEQIGGMEILSFSNESAKYSIYSNQNEIGIKVTTKGRTYNMKGIMPKKKSSLSILRDKELNNLNIIEE